MSRRDDAPIDETPTHDELRMRVGELLNEQIRMALGVGGLISADAAAAVEHLATAYMQFEESYDNE